MVEYDERLDKSTKINRKYIPGSSAVFVERIKVFARQQLASVDTRLYSAQTSQYTNLFHVTHQGNDIESLQLGVDGVQPANEVFEEQLERLG